MRKSFTTRLAISTAAQKPVFSDVLHEIPERDKALVFAIMKKLSQKTDLLVFYDRETVLSIAAEIGASIDAVFSSPFQMAGLTAQKINHVLSHGGFSVFDFDSNTSSIFPHKKKSSVVPQKNAPRPTVIFKEKPLGDEKPVGTPLFKQKPGIEELKKVSRPLPVSFTSQPDLLQPSFISKKKEKVSKKISDEETLTSGKTLSEYAEEFKSTVRNIRAATSLRKANKALIAGWLKIYKTHNLAKVLDYFVQEKILQEGAFDMFDILIPEENYEKVG